MAPDPTAQGLLDRFWEKNGDRVELLEDPCRPTTLPAAGKLEEAYTQACGGQCMVVWFYYGEDERLHSTRGCVLCDKLYEMPRFQ